MPAKQVQIRRGSTFQHSTFTGRQGELTYNTTSGTVHAHNGVTPGGVQLARENVANVLDFGGLADNVTDIGPALQAAIDTGKPVLIPAGTYRIKTPVYITAANQQISGAGLESTKIYVDPAIIAVGALGVFINAPTTMRYGAFFNDFSVYVEQEETAVRANLLDFPPVIYCDNVPRGRFERLHIELAKTAIKFVGNIGGAHFMDCEFSVTDKGIWMVQQGGESPGYPADSIRMNACHFWVFGMGPGLDTLQRDGNAYSIYCEKADDFCIINSLFFRTGVYVGGGFGSITGCDFDDDSPLEVAGGYWSATTCQLNSVNVTSNGNDGELVITGCNLGLPNIDTLRGGITGKGMIRIDGTGQVSGWMRLNISGCNFRWGAGSDNSLIWCKASRLSVSNCNFFWLHTDWSHLGKEIPKPVIHCEGQSRVLISDCQASDVGVNVQAFVKIVTPGVSGTIAAISNMIIPGRYLDIPAYSTDQGVVSISDVVSGTDLGTCGSTTRVFGSPPVFTPNDRRTGDSTILSFSGTLDGSGAANVAHGAGATTPSRVMTVGAWYRTGAGTAEALVVKVDGTNIILTGGSAGVAYRVRMELSNVSEIW